MARKRRSWSKIVQHHGVRVRLFERAGAIYRDVTLGRVVSSNGKARTNHDIKSLGHSDRTLAEDQAKSLCEALAKARLVGTAPDKLTLGQLFRLYAQHRHPSLKPGRRRYSETCMAMFLECWGEDRLVADIGQDDVDRFVRLRRSGELVPPGLRPREDGTKPRGWRETGPVRDGTLHSNLIGWLSPVFNWAHRRKVGGKRLLSGNPLNECVVPREKNKLRPIASHARYVDTQDHTDAVDPAGRLRCVLALARYAGRRESAICEVRADDVFLTAEQIRCALAASGLDEGIASHMPHGAIRWGEDTDKQGLRFVTALARGARVELDRYLEKQPRLRAAVAGGWDVPLFPSPRLPEKALSHYTAAKWLLRAEKLAEQPKLERGAFHPYRRLWATERKHLPDADVATAGGWKDPATMKQSYQQADAATVLKVIDLDG